MNQRIKELLGDLKILRGYRISDEKSFCERVARQLGNLPEASSLMGEYDDIIEAAIEKEYERMKSVSNINININREVTPVVSSDDDIFKIFGTARTPNSQNRGKTPVVNSGNDTVKPFEPAIASNSQDKGKTPVLSKDDELIRIFETAIASNNQDKGKTPVVNSGNGTDKSFETARVSNSQNRGKTPVLSKDDELIRIFEPARVSNNQNKSNVNESSKVDAPLVPINIKDDKQKEKTVRVTPVVRSRVNTEMVDKGKEKKVIDEVDLKDTTLRVYDILKNMENIGEKIILKDEEYFCKRVAKKVLREVDDIDIVECGEYDENIESIIRSEYQDLIKGKWKFKEKESLVRMNIDIENIHGMDDMRHYVREYLDKLIKVLGYSYDNQNEVIEKIVTLVNPDYYAGIIIGKYEDYMKALVISGSEEYQVVVNLFRRDKRFVNFSQNERLNMILEGIEIIKRIENGTDFLKDNDFYQKMNYVVDEVIKNHSSKIKNDIDAAKNIGMAAATIAATAATGDLFALPIYGAISLYKKTKAASDYEQLKNIQVVNQILNEENNNKSRR